MKVWVLTPFAKEAARHFQAELESGQMMFMDDRTLKLNPLQPVRGQSLLQLVGTRADAARYDHWWRDGTCNLYASRVEAAYSEFGTSSECGPFPCLWDLKEDVGKLHFSLKRRAEYAESLERGIDTLLRNAPEVFNCSRGMDISQLANSNIIFDFGSLDTITRVYILHCLLDNLMAYRQISPGPHGRLFILIDEASEYLTVSRERDDIHEPFLYSATRRARHHSISIGLITQTSFDIVPELMVNIHNKVVFRIEDGLSKRTLAGTLGLTPDQAKELGELPNRMAVMKIPSCPSPFVVQVPEMVVTVADEELLEAVEIGKACARRLNWEPRAVQRRAERQGKAEKIETGQAAVCEHDVRMLSKDALDYLCNINEDPFKAATARDEQMRFSASRGKRVREELEEAGYVKRHVIPTGRRGGSLVVEEITDGGTKLLRDIGVAINHPRGRGAWPHVWWQDKAAEWLKRRYEDGRVKIEADSGPGKLIDVLLLLPGQSNDQRAIAFEILVNDDGVSDTRDDLASGCNEVVLCVDRWETAERLKEKIRKELGDDAQRKVSFRLLGGFLD